MCREQKSVSDFCIGFAHPKHADPRVGLLVPRWLEHVIRCGVKQTMLKTLLLKVISDKNLLDSKSHIRSLPTSSPQLGWATKGNVILQYKKDTKKVFQMRLLGAFGKVRLLLGGGFSSTLLAQSLEFLHQFSPQTIVSQPHCFRIVDLIPTQILYINHFFLDLHWVSSYPLHWDTSYPSTAVVCYVPNPEALRSRNALGLFVAQPPAEKTAGEGPVGIVCKTHGTPSQTNKLTSISNIANVQNIYRVTYYMSYMYNIWKYTHARLLYICHHVPYTQRIHIVMVGCLSSINLVIQKW